MSAKRLLSLSAVARRLDLSYPRAMKLFHAGVLNPHHVAGKIALFDEAALPDLHRAAHAAAMGNRPATRPRPCR